MVVHDETEGQYKILVYRGTDVDSLPLMIEGTFDAALAVEFVILTAVSEKSTLNELNQVAFNEPHGAASDGQLQFSLFTYSLAWVESPPGNQ